MSQIRLTPITSAILFTTSFIPRGRLPWASQLRQVTALIPHIGAISSVLRLRCRRMRRSREPKLSSGGGSGAGTHPSVALVMVSDCMDFPQLVQEQGIT